MKMSRSFSEQAASNCILLEYLYKSLEVRCSVGLLVGVMLGVCHFIQHEWAKLNVKG